MLADLKKFLLRGNVVDLAVAVVIGVAFAAVIDALVTYIINPIIAGIFGEPDLTGVLAFDIGDATVSIGGFLDAVLNFLIVGIALFFVVQAFEALQRRRSAGHLADAPPPSDEVVLLTQIRDALVNRGI